MKTLKVLVIRVHHLDNQYLDDQISGQSVYDYYQFLSRFLLTYMYFTVVLYSKLFRQWWMFAIFQYKHWHIFFYSREKFFEIVKEECSANFKVNIDKILGHLSKSGKVVDDNIRSLFFGDYMTPENKVYNEVTDLKELTAAMEKWVQLQYTCLCILFYLQLSHVLISNKDKQIKARKQLYSAGIFHTILGRGKGLVKMGEA